MTHTYAIMPVLSGQSLTEAAIGDVLAQSVPMRLLVINQGVDSEFREHLERLAEQYEDRLLLWSHDPPLPSLSATWNRALQFVWETGATEAFVVNNDVRLHPLTVMKLHTLLRWPKREVYFVSAVGVTQEQFDAWDEQLIDPKKDYDHLTIPAMQALFDDLSKGGPDFSCFLITKEGHEKYPFDEGFIPAYGEDCDLHRRYILGGDGEKIFSINLPYWHVGGGSNTLKSLDPDKRQALERRLGQSRAYYEKKWGGPVNHERWTIPFEPQSDQDHVTNPELQAGEALVMSSIDPVAHT